MLTKYLDTVAEAEQKKTMNAMAMKVLNRSTEKQYSTDILILRRYIDGSESDDNEKRWIIWQRDRILWFFDFEDDKVVELDPDATNLVILYTANLQMPSKAPTYSPFFISVASNWAW